MYLSYFADSSFDQSVSLSAKARDLRQRLAYYEDKSALSQEERQHRDMLERSLATTMGRLQAVLRSS